jgi:phospholipase/carboxylesterase
MDATWPHTRREGEPLVLALHGTGGDEHQMAPLADALLPGAGVLAPRGRVSEGGANRWFRRLAEGVFDVDDVETRADELAEAVRSEPIAVAIGFSNGANMALATAMRHPGVVPAVIAFSGMYPFGDLELTADLTGLRVLLVGGAADPMAPRTSVDRLEASLRAAGADVTRAERAGGHGITDDDLAAARAWLARGTVGG